MYFIAYDNESFEEAVSSTVVPSETIHDAVKYALHDFSKGFINSFRIYNAEGSLILSREVL